METVQTRQLDDVAAVVAELDLPGLGEEADWLGRLDRIIGDLRAMRATVIDELDGPVTGTEYRVTEQRKATRSYNTAAIVAAFSEAGWELRDLLDADAVRLAWRWTELRKAYGTAGLTMQVAAREVTDQGDLDEPAIGEVWSSYYKIEGVK